MIEEEKIIDSYKRYINHIEQQIDDYYKLDDSFYKDEIEQLELNLILLRKLLNLVEKQDKVIDEMAEHILMHSEHLAKYFCEGVKENVCESRGSTIQGCNYCIKQYFYRKVEDNE